MTQKKLRRTALTKAAREGSPAVQRLSVSAEMVIIGIGISGIMLLLHKPIMALALLCVMPVALFHGWLTRRGIAGSSAVRLILLTLGRTMAGLAVMTAAFYVNTDALIGALFGLTLEAHAHIVAGIRRLIKNR